MLFLAILLKFLFSLAKLISQCFIFVIIVLSKINIVLFWYFDKLFQVRERKCIYINKKLI